MPDEVEKIKLYQDPIPLFFRYNVENQIDTLHSPVVQLRSGGYLVINPTEALVSIDVNSGRATRERHIEETALKTNLEAADEVGRQLRLRDLAGLVVIDFIDMEDSRNNAAVERRLKESMRNDRARLQIGRLSPFGLMELSRQRLRPSLMEISFEKCPHCAGVGFIRSVDSAALSVLRVIEEEGIKQRSEEIIVHMPTRIALYLLNQKRAALSEIEKRYNMQVLLHNDDTLVQPDYKLERVRNRTGGKPIGPAVDSDQIFAEAERELPPVVHTTATNGDATSSDENEASSQRPRENNVRGRRRFRDRDNFKNRNRNNRPDQAAVPASETPPVSNGLPSEGEEVASPNSALDSQNNQDGQRRRRRGRRGGRRRNGAEGHESGDHWERRPRHSEENAQQRPVDSAPQVPASVYELDTTPRDTPRHSSSQHENVNPSTDKPKGGWWRRITGQEE
jgi:ribonuclease E